MSEANKEECCGTNNKGCGGCGGIKKLIFMLVLGLIVFMCGYVIGKGHSPFACSGKMCPITPH